MIKLLEKNGVEICDIITVVEKINYNGVKRIKKETGYEVRCLLKIDCSGDKSIVVLDK